MAKARKRRSKAGKIIFVIEIVVLVLLIGALAAYSFVNSKLNKLENDTVDMNLSLIHILSAVTAACMMSKKSLFEKAGGFAEELAVAFNDIDYCMKIRSLGLSLIHI